jgi:hypothetical protein
LIGERRLNLLREFSARLTSGKTLDDVWAALGPSLATGAQDLPFNWWASSTTCSTCPASRAARCA